MPGFYVKGRHLLRVQVRGHYLSGSSFGGLFISGFYAKGHYMSKLHPGELAFLNSMLDNFVFPKFISKGVVCSNSILEGFKFPKSMLEGLLSMSEFEVERLSPFPRHGTRDAAADMIASRRPRNQLGNEPDEASDGI
jgi:hypothetical protein